MYVDVKLKKTNICKGLLDDYEYEAFKEVLALTKIQEGTAVRQAINDFVERHHAFNSIGREPVQQDFLNKFKRA